MRLLELQEDKNDKSKLVVGPFSNNVVKVLSILPEEYSLLFHHIHHFTTTKGYCNYSTKTKKRIVGRNEYYNFNNRLSHFLEYKAKGKAHHYRTLRAVGNQYISISKELYTRIQTRLDNYNSRYVCVGSFRIDSSKVTNNAIKPYQIENFNNGFDEMSMNDCGKWFQKIGTNVNKESLYCLEDNIIEIDLVSCQASIMADVMFYDSYDKEELFKLTLNNTRIANGKEPLSYQKYKKDCIKWKSLINSVGDVYSYIQNEINIENELEFYTRDDVKKQFSMFLCESNYQSKYNKVLNWISDFVPTLFETICDYKIFQTNGTKQFQLHNKIFKLCSDLFSSITTKMQSKNNHNIPFIYRNDALLVRERDVKEWCKWIDVKLESFDLVSKIKVERIYKMVDGHKFPSTAKANLVKFYIDNEEVTEKEYEALAECEALAEQYSTVTILSPSIGLLKKGANSNRVLNPVLKGAKRKKSSILVYKNGFRIKINGNYVYSEKGQSKDKFKDELKKRFNLLDEDFKEDQEPTINKEEMIKEPETQNPQSETQNPLSEIKSPVLDPSCDIVEPNLDVEEDDFVARMVKQFGVTYPIKTDL